MDPELQHLADWAAPLLDGLSPHERRTLALAVAKDLRADNVRTMRAQQAPDGTAWASRKAPARPIKARTAPTGQVRRRTRNAKNAQAMFVKLRTTRHLKAGGTPSEALVQFVGRAERIARVHHHGLPDLVKPGGPTYNYPARPLIGITDAAAARIGDLILSHLKGKAY